MRLTAKLGSVMLSVMAAVAGCGDGDDDPIGSGGEGGTSAAGRGGAGSGGRALGGAGAGGSGTGGTRPGAGTGGEAVGGSGAMGGEGGVAGGGGEGAAGAGGGDGVQGDTFVVTSANRLLSFNRSAPEEQLSSLEIQGLLDDESIVGVDFRPLDGLLYGIGSSGRLYAIDTQTAEASLVAELSPAAGDMTDPYVEFDGQVSYGVDFNPAADLLRVVSSSGVNLRIVPSDRSINGVAQLAGATFTDGALNPGQPSVEAAAYDDNFNLTCRTRLFVIDPATDKLYLQSPPNDGVLVERGALGINASEVGGFDIVTDTEGDALPDTAVALIRVADSVALFEVDLATGAATEGGTVALEEDESVTGMAVSTPAPTVAPEQAPGELLAVTESNQLISFNRGTPRNTCTRVEVSDIGDADIVGIDVRPANGLLYAVTDDSQLYTVVPATGAATLQGAFDNDLDGTSFAVGFNPAADRLRIISDTGQNLRVVPPAAPGTVTAIIDTVTSAPGITAVAYSNSFAGTKLTTLFGIDTATDSLVRIGGNPGSASTTCPTPAVVASTGNPNCGVVTTLRALGLSDDVSDVNGFDIEGATGTALAVVTLGAATQSTLISLGLAVDGTTTLLGTVGAGERLRGLTFAADPVVTPTVYAVTADNQLLSFAPTTPADVDSLPITGLQSAESVLAIDFRPANSTLYALGTAGRLYTLSTATGAVTLVAALAADPADLTIPFGPFVGSVGYGMDFNPVVDRLRLVTEEEQNLRVVPTSGLTTTDTALSPVGLVGGAAYTNSYAGALATQLFVIDSASDELRIQGNPSPNDGILQLVGALGVNADGNVGFDIAGIYNPTFANAFAMAAFTPTGGMATLYSVNLTSGAATAYNATASVIGSGSPLRGIAIDLD